MSGLFLSFFLYLFLISPISLDNYYAANNSSEINHDGYGGSFSKSDNNSLFWLVATSISGSAKSIEADSKSGGGGVR